MTYILNNGEQAVAKILAILRNEINRAKGLLNKKHSGQPDWKVEIEGVGSEMAVSHVLNVFPPISLNPDAGWDITYKGKKIDVKTTEYINGMLIADPTGKLGEVDMFLLTTGSFPQYTIRGWATKRKLCQEKNLTVLKEGCPPVYALPQDELKSIGEMIDAEPNR